MRHCIVGILDQYAMARGSHDVEYVVCRMTTGKEKTFENDSSDFEAFVKDRDEYWRNNGWQIVVKSGRRTLTPIRASVD